MVAGVVIAANCQIALPAFGTLFMLVGAVLTAASYRGPGEDEDKNSYAARIAFTGNSRILGPICIVVGALMLALGVLLCTLTRRARRRERRVGFHCPLHGDFYPLSPVQGIKMLESNMIVKIIAVSTFPFQPNSNILTTLVKNTISLFAKTIELEFPLYDKTMKLCLASRSMDKYNLSHELKEGVAQKHEQGCFTWM
ncbi:hypothetical protein EAG_02865 [Camponotus floridanus]|uniref:Uncharacterized protein n=1 Tax=Camponotus floridanus TaxID=104421 RepID=E2AGE5_CAMFO|nr:hypothetical protein EAG_02865 [Camponotus floridanus]